jgi:hypothetical protein
MWSSVTEHTPSERIVLISTCSRLHQETEGREEVKPERAVLSLTDPEDEVEKEMEKMRESRLCKQNPPHESQQPGHLHIVMSSSRCWKFVVGYQKDHLLCKAWSEAPDLESPLTPK